MELGCDYFVSFAKCCVLLRRSINRNLYLDVAPEAKYFIPIDTSYNAFFLRCLRMSLNLTKGCSTNVLPLRGTVIAPITEQLSRVSLKIDFELLIIAGRRAEKSGVVQVIK